MVPSWISPLPIGYNCPMIKTKTLLIAAALFSLAIIGAGIGVTMSMNADNSAPNQNIQGLLWPPTKHLKPFNLVNQRGQPFNLDSLRGKWTLLYFGYTHCTYLCPTTLAALHGFEKRLDKQGYAGNEQVVFVTVDPQRDTPKRLSKYLASFSKDFVGVTGSEAQLERLTRQFGILHQKTDQKGPDDYQMNHSASVLLIDPKEQLVGTFGAQQSAGNIFRRFLKIRGFVESRT